MLITNYPDGFIWFLGDQAFPETGIHPTNTSLADINYGTLPSALAILQPRGVRFVPEISAQNQISRSSVQVVRIWILGGHSTGHPSLWFSLEVPVGPGADSYTPEGSTRDFCSVNRHGYKRVADHIFEVTY
jgi:hypothetical protein